MAVRPLKVLNCSTTLFCNLLAVSAYAQGPAGTYTKCSIPAPDTSTSGNYCLPKTQAEATTTTLNFPKIDNSDFTVVSVPVRNCRDLSGALDLRGTTVLAVDSSASMRTVDPSNGRLGASTAFLNEFKSNSGSSSAVAGSVDFPKLGLLSYGGRAVTPIETNGTLAYETDGLNQKSTPKYCESADTNPNVYPSQREKWYNVIGLPAMPPLNETDTFKNIPANYSLESLCEYLHPVAGTDATRVNRLGGFLKYTGQIPRGSTDLTYHLKAAPEANLLGTVSPPRGKNLIVVTDGLPNISKRVPESICKQKAYLQSETIQTDPNTQKRYCIDRQFRVAAAAAHNVITEEKFSAYNGINVYNVLYLGGDTIYNDFDDIGELNPADFLAENSARSGNGKVKFRVVKDSAGLGKYLKEIFPNFSKSAIHHVEITVNANPPYTAVSPNGGELFSLKFINLKTGANSVKVDIYYNDEKVTQTYNVTVGDGATAIPGDYKCVDAPQNRTVDGDKFDERNPRGDGVKPAPIAGPLAPGSRAGSADRVYRNNDPGPDGAGDADGRKNFGSAVGRRGVGESKEVSVGQKIRNGEIRIQGGTGNCGVVAQTTGRRSSAFIIDLLLFLPLVAVGFFSFRRRKQK